MADYAVSRLEEIEVLDDGRLPWRPVRHHFGITAFGATAWTAGAGERLINEHDEADGGQEELYLVLSGRAVFELDGERRDAPSGTFVFAKPGVTRTAVAEEAGTTVVVIGATPGKPYEDIGWELWAHVRPLYDGGDYGAAADAALEVAEANPSYPGIWYNLACCESLAGRADEAIEHLRRAVGMSEELTELARGDSDFDPIRGRPEFSELVDA
jgi:quercetin dioxygenase-like cupin family protein